MKLHLPSLLFAVSLVGGFARAATFVDVQNPNQYIAPGANISGVFNIVTPGSSSYTISGFPSGNGTFTDAGGYVLGTALSDVDVRFYLRDSTTMHLNLVDLALGSYSPTDPIWLAGRTATIKFDGQLAQINFIQQHGFITYSIGSDLGDFTLAYALLSATTTTSASVPDGAMTCALLGLGLLGVVVLQRRLAKAD